MDSQNLADCQMKKNFMKVKSLVWYKKFRYRATDAGINLNKIFKKNVRVPNSKITK